MALPWNTNKSVNLFFDEFNQELGINRILNRAIENDIFIENKTKTVLSGDIKALKFASKTEIIALEENGKTISPENFMSLSATSRDVTSKSFRKFMTQDIYKQSIQSYFPKTIFVDLSFKGFFTDRGIIPTDEQILEKVDEVLVNSLPPDDTILYAWYIYRKKVGNKHVDILHQNTYRMVDRVWTFVRRREMTKPGGPNGHYITNI